ncbi:hypothetical protein HBI56_093880 [Parastagonospora nodorum]|nr:hypothetical protein HBH74_062720 [Parastagonospora nodorum]KAH4951810.1 hypothetical protein HBH73_103120 [Parastagonospora nodorum]KAH4993799.1 hypothetical protein HBI76_029830 [Parastagonospora nodorum]KAH5116889.1 hypothetical protein HBH71_116240 [Parastagonospora nodorum]KAH5287021.1 hypothetical protein HBI70_014040 [Parastagonospora nodorum]
MIVECVDAASSIDRGAAERRAGRCILKKEDRSAVQSYVKWGGPRQMDVTWERSNVLALVYGGGTFRALAVVARPT